MTDAETIAELRWMLHEQTREIFRLRAALQAEQARRYALPDTKGALDLGSTPFLDWCRRAAKQGAPND
jgi:hypothetical protein